MSKIDFEVKCECCSGETLLQFAGCDKASILKVIENQNITKIRCEKLGHGCGCTFELEQSGEEIQVKNVSQPWIEKIEPPQGSINGGNLVEIKGHALNRGGLIVRFDGVAAPKLTKITDKTALVVVPPGSFLLKIQRYVGDLAPNQELRGVQSGATGIIDTITSVEIRLSKTKGKFSPGEAVMNKARSGSALVASFDHIDSTSNVTVENVNGFDPIDGILIDGYTYIV